ncbi:MAG: hypothetical protein ACE5J9_11795 [Methanosarcinales archaeon]
MNKEEFRKRIKEIREKEWIRDALLLRNKKPEETLKIMFDLCEFAAKINKVKNENLGKYCKRICDSWRNCSFLLGQYQNY